MDRLLQDIRFGIRTLLRAPSFTIVAVLTIALAIGANTAMFSVINAVLLRPLPYHQPDRVMAAWQVDPNGSPNAWTTPNFVEWKRQGGIVGSMSLGLSVSRRNVVLGGGSSRTLRRLLAASFMNAEVVKRKMARRASTGGR